MLKTYLLLALTFASTEVNSQSAHYWTESFGTRSMLLNGVVIGSVEDLGAVYYNPARLSQFESPAFVISGQVYELSSVIIENGKGVMPGFAQLSHQERIALINFLNDESEDEMLASEEKPLASPYGYTGFNRFLDDEGYPAVKPPWGTLNAINLNTGEYEWTTTLGEFDELTARGIPPTGTENYGGPVVTAGGLIFIGASKDEKFRAFDKQTGEVLWETKLPAGGYATPSTYEVNGKQYVVIACGGGKMGTKSGDAYVAFALP